MVIIVAQAEEIGLVSTFEMTSRDKDNRRCMCRKLGQSTFLSLKFAYDLAFENLGAWL